MNRPKSSEQLEAIVSAMEKFRDGATFIDVAASLHPVPPMRTVQRWLGVLVRQKRLIRVGSARATRYKLPESARTEPSPFASTEGRALHQLVTQPLAERAPADYRRVAVERYRANETCHLSFDFRLQIAQGWLAGEWQQPPNFARVVCELASRCLSLEDALVAPAARLRREPRHLPFLTLPALSAADLAAWLAQPERPGVRADVQLAWNIRAILTDWAARGPALALTPELLQQVYQRVTSAGGPVRVGYASPAPIVAGGGVAGALGAMPFRASPLSLAETVYEPPADRWLIETCFEHVLRVAAAIDDPLERAFFLCVHLLYLLPFERCNATMALLTMNVSLIAARLPPITFAAAQPGDMLAGIRAVWELNRTELLRDLFAAPPPRPTATPITH